jgi:diacylglycerol diphosphate phosphatase/phosphatidate phosphatase
MLDFLRYDSAGHKKPPVDKKRRMRLLRSYIPDWIITIGLWVSLASCAVSDLHSALGKSAHAHRLDVPHQAVFYALDKIIGYRRLFSITDESLQHPYAEHERVPVYALALIAGVFPLLVILVTAALITRSFWDAHNGVLGLALSLGLTVTFTDIVKVSPGGTGLWWSSYSEMKSGISNPS